MKLSFYIILFLTLFINNIYSIDLVEETCFNNILSKVQENQFIDYDKSIICSQGIYNFVCDSNGYITSIPISDASTVKQTLLWSDFSCLTKIQNIFLSQTVLEDEFLYLINTELNKLTLSSTSVAQINKLIPIKIKTLTIDSLTSVVKASYLKNVQQVVFQNTNPGFELEVDGGQTGSLLDNLVIYSNKLPDLTNSQIFKICNFKFILPVDQTTITNLGTFTQKCKSITLSATSAFDFEIPDSFQTAVNQIYSSITFGNFMYLRTNSLLDLSNNENPLNEGRFIWNNAYSGSNFHVDGRFPFSKFPKNYSSLSFDMFMSYYDFLPDLSVFKGYGDSLSISIRDCVTKNGTLQANNGIFTGVSTLTLSENNLQGLLDPSWCNGVLLNVQDNSLSGALPLCYFCYLDDETVKSRFQGNDFNNYEITDRSDCNYKTIIPNILLLSSVPGNKSFKIFGENLGYNKANLATNVPATLSYDSFGNLLNGNIANDVDKFNLTIVSLGLTYTLSISTTPPIINQVIQNNDTFSFIGEFFTYNKTDSTILIDNYQSCQITDTTFYQIDCVVNKQLRDKGSRPTTFTVKDLQTTTNLNYQYLTLQCFEPCGNGYCNTVNGTCTCFKNWITVEGYGNCMVANHYVSSVTQVPIKVGGSVILHGWFGPLNDNLEVSIGNEKVNITSFDQNSITISVGPGSGIQTIQIKQNNHSWVGKFYIYYSTVVLCSNNCTNNGICNFGQCDCFNSYSGEDCSIKINNNSTSKDTPSVKVNNGSITFTNNDINFLISIKSIHEIDLNGRIVDTWTLNNVWSEYSVVENSNSNPLVSTFFQNRTIDNSTITLLVEHVEKAKKFSFAGINFTVQDNGVKFTLQLKDWDYKSNLNTLQMEISANSDMFNTNPCLSHTESFESGSSNTQIENSVNYLKIVKDNKIFYGRFLSKMLSNGFPIDIQTMLKSNTSEQISVIINLPKCDECILDPDFSVLIDPNYQNKENNCGSNKKWVLPVAIIVPVVVVSIIIVVVVVYTKKNSVDLRVGLRNVSMKSFTDRSRK